MTDILLAFVIGGSGFVGKEVVLLLFIICIEIDRNLGKSIKLTQCEVTDQELA